MYPTQMLMKPLIYNLINPMERSPSREPKTLSASQEILHLIWSLKVHYYAHKSLPLDSILNQINADHTLTPYFLKTYHNIITPSLNCLK